jgi:flagellar biosynthesis/type III secretory pathway protein FliH
MATRDPQTYQAEYVDGYQQGYVHGYRTGYQQGLEEGSPRARRLRLKTMRCWLRTQLARPMRQAHPLTREVAVEAGRKITMSGTGVHKRPL